jgi:hypothetical protein
MKELADSVPPRKATRKSVFDRFASDQRQALAGLSEEKRQFVRSKVRHQDIFDLLEARGRRLAKQPVASPVRQRGSHRAPKRVGRPGAKRTAAKATADPAPPEPPRAGGVVSDLSGFGDLTPRAFRDWVRRRKIPHAKIGRRLICRLGDVLAAVGLEPRADIAPPVEDRECARLRLVASLTSGTRKAGAR